MKRIVILIVALAFVALPELTLAADTLGGRVTSSVYIDTDPTITVTNLGNVAMTFTFKSSSFTVSPSSIALAPNAIGTVTVAGTDASGTVVVTGESSVDPVAGTDRSAIQFTTKVTQHAPSKGADYSGLEWALVLGTGITVSIVAIGSRVVILIQRHVRIV